MENKDYFQSYEYWFENPEHEVVDNYNENYYAYRMYKYLIPQLSIPKDGYIVVLGTHKCVSFKLLCEMFGENRCIGYDLYNPSGHHRVLIKDCLQLGRSDDIPIAFVHNDAGNFPKTLEVKMAAQKWAARNVVKGGIFLGRNNFNSRKIDMEKMMDGLGFFNINLEKMSHLPNLNLNEDEIKSHMLSIKVK